MAGIIALWARQAYSYAEGVAYFSSGLQGGSINDSESAGMMAGLQAVGIPVGMAVVLALAGVALLVAAAVRKPPATAA